MHVVAGVKLENLKSNSKYICSFGEVGAKPLF